MDTNKIDSTIGLFEAILRGELGEVKKHLHMGADPNENLRTLLYKYKRAFTQHQKQRMDEFLASSRFASNSEYAPKLFVPLNVSIDDISDTIEMNETKIAILRALLDAGAKIESLSFPPDPSSSSSTFIMTTGELISHLMEEPHENTRALMQVSSILGQYAEKQTKTVLDSMLKDGKDYDIVFVCPDGRVEAHKNVLAAAFTYFASAFSTDWKENKTGEWKTEKPAHVIRNMIEFAYKGTVTFFDVNENKEEETTTTTTTTMITSIAERPSPHTKILELFSAAHEFQMKKLVGICQEELNHLLTRSNLQDILEAAALHNASNLKSICFKFMSKNSRSILTDYNLIVFASRHEDLWKEFQQYCAVKNGTNHHHSSSSRKRKATDSM